MTNLWEVAVLIIAVTVMVVNVWNVFLTTKILLKYEPFLDKCMGVANKAMDATAKLFEEEDDEN